MISARPGRYIVSGRMNDAGYGRIYSHDGHLWVAWLGSVSEWDEEVQKTELVMLLPDDQIFATEADARSAYQSRLTQPPASEASEGLA